MINITALAIPLDFFFSLHPLLTLYGQASATNKKGHSISHPSITPFIFRASPLWSKLFFFQVFEHEASVVIFLIHVSYVSSNQNELQKELGGKKSTIMWPHIAILVGCQQCLAYQPALRPPFLGKYKDLHKQLTCNVLAYVLTNWRRIEAAC